MRLSQAEREAIERAAARELRRPSDYIRAIVLKHIAEEGEKERRKASKKAQVAGTCAKPNSPLH